MHCKLCNSNSVSFFFQDPPRSYVHCSSCDLIFTAPDSHLTPQQERARYEMHDNTESNTGYVKYLESVANIADSVTPSDGLILDFGCGKNAVLVKTLRRLGRLCDCWDPLFNYRIDFTDKHYDTIILCEVIEHLRELQTEIHLVRRLLNPHAYIIIRTQLYSSLDSFPRWWYRQDSTHINFFSNTTMSFLATVLGMHCTNTDYKDIFIFNS